MGDQFEKFIVANRDAFDDAVPSDNVWISIDQKMARKKAFWTHLWKVAALLFMASTIYLMISRTSETVATGAVLSDEFTQAESYYVNLIHQKRKAISEQMSPDQQVQFLEEIDQLDALYDELKETYQTNASNDRVVDAMINNLQLRLDILTKQLDILRRIKDQNNEKDLSIEI